MNSIVAPKIIDMPEALREMMLEVHDGDARALPLVHRIFNSPYRWYIFQWLIAHHLTGAQFIGWFNVECRRSPMYMVSVLESRIKGLPKPRLIESGNAG